MTANISKILFVFFLFLLCSPADAESEADRPVTLDAGVMLSSAYLWRGDVNCGAHVQPDVAFNFKGFKLDFYGYIPFDNSYKEIDIELVYTYKAFSVHLLDCFARCNWYEMPDNWFEWSKQKTNHYLEMALVFAPKKYPFHIKWFTFLYGDWFTDVNGLRGAPTFSSYLEAGVHHTFERICTASLIVGSSILKGMYTDYSKDFAVIHCELKASRVLTCGSVSFPISASFLVNPYRKKSYFAASVGIMF